MPVELVLDRHILSIADFRARAGLFDAGGRDAGLAATGRMREHLPIKLGWREGKSTGHGS